MAAPLSRRGQGRLDHWRVVVALVFFRFYGPERAVFDRSVKLPDVRACELKGADRAPVNDVKGE
jgi:hypothetical protein